MKIAAVTEDEVNISQHFGRAPYYLVYTVEEGDITDKEIRDRSWAGEEKCGKIKGTAFDGEQI